MKVRNSSSYLACLAHVVVSAAVAVALLAQPTPVHGDHIPTALDIADVRTPMPGEGYLMYAVNPFRGRPGDEWTGWVDVRHPSLAGARDVATAYDRSDRFVQVRSTILVDNTAPAAGSVAPDNRVVDFDFANKAYVYQAGVSVLETATRRVDSPAVGTEGTFSFPLDFDEERAIMARPAPNGNGPAPTIEFYYSNGLSSGANGETYYPSLNPGAGNEAIFKGTGAFQSTFPHELYHFVGDGQAVHQPLAGDVTHSMDQANIVRTSGVAVNSLDEVGPVLSATVGGKLQITAPQVERMFSAAGTAPFFPAAQRGDNDAAGHRVDWDFVADHSRFTTGGVEFGLEGLGGGADNHAGIDSLFWRIGATVPSIHPLPDANNGGHDHTGLGVFGPVPDFARPFFDTADVFSLSTRYADSDIDLATGLRNSREASLDYDLLFLGANGEVVPGIPIAVFIEGWSRSTTVDNYVARWASPIPAVGVFILAHEFGVNGHDGNVQIDAIIVAQSVPEPASVALLGVGAVSLLLGYRLRRWRAATRIGVAG